MDEHQMKDEALRLALEALEYPGPSWLEARQPAITAIKQALEETPRVSPEPEPVATVYEGAIAKWNLPEKFTGFLYTSPQRALDKKAENARELGLDYEPEPVACKHRIADVTNEVVKSGYMCMDCGALSGAYTSPPKREWQGLTDEDKQIAFDDTQEGGGFWEFADAIEAKLKEKNT